MRKMSKVLNRIVVAFLIALLTMTLTPGLRVRAQEDAAGYASSETGIGSVESGAYIDLGRTGSLKVVHYIIGDDDKDVRAPKGVTSRIYLIATVDERGHYTIKDEFAGYKYFAGNPDFFNKGFNYDQWKNCVTHTGQDRYNSDTGELEEYINNNGIKPVAEGVSNDNGETDYTGLALGVYFVLSDDIVIGDYTHSFINFVYPVPILEKRETGGNLKINYNPVASPKKSKVYNGEEVHCSLQKQWNDSGYSNRPASVTFEIYCDGELMETVTLSSSNNWYHEWEDLGVHDYSVKEIGIAEGYSSEITVYQKPGTHDFYYTCVNSYGGGDEPPPPGDNPPPPGDNPPPPEGGVLGAFRDLPQVLGAVRQLPQVLGARRLPQTGQLWWPIPILLIVGVFFIVKGIRKNAKNSAK